MKKNKGMGCSLSKPGGHIVGHWESQDDFEKWMKEHPDENEAGDPVHGRGRHRVVVEIGNTGRQILYDVDSDTGIKASELLKLAVIDLVRSGMDCTMRHLPGGCDPPGVVLDQGLVDDILRLRSEYTPHQLIETPTKACSVCEGNCEESGEWLALAMSDPPKSLDEVPAVKAIKYICPVCLRRIRGTK